MGALESALDALDEALLALVQRAPEGSPSQLRAAAELALGVALAVPDGGASGAVDRASNGDKLLGELTGLACAMELCLELIGEGRVDAGVALPALAMAAHTARSSYAPAVSAARYELETLLPIPGKEPAPRTPVDVPAAKLLRRPERAAEAGEALAAATSPAAVSAQRISELFATHSEAAVARVGMARQALRRRVAPPA